jgi:ABC-type glycerol-3-phosphate transport system substrate-binding protein
LYSPGLVDGINWGGHYYGSVNIVQWYVLYYRPSWLKAAGVTKIPETWEEVYQASKKAREWAKGNLGRDYYGFTFGATKAGHIHIAMLSALTFSQGGRLLKDGKFNLDTPEFRNSWNYLVKMINEDVADVACLAYSWNDYQKVFGMGKAAMMLGYSVYAVKFGGFPEVTKDWAAVAPPKWDAKQPDSNRVGYINYDTYVINNFADDKHKAAAMLFLDFYRSKEACMYELLVEGNDSFLPAVYEDPNIVDKVDWELAKEVAKKIKTKEPKKMGITIPEVRAASAKTARIEALPPGAAYVSDILSEYLGKAGTKKMDPDKALSEALSKIKKFTH